MFRPVVLLLSLLAFTLPAPAADAPDFEREVRPILSQHCFKCHGPDEKTRKAELRLDSREAALKPAKSGEVAIVPGDAENSDFVVRILSHDPDEMMPPPDAKIPLPPEKKQILRRWVAAGAKYEPHWAFVNPRRAAIPPTKQSLVANSAKTIDAFIGARLEKEGLTPAAAADPYTLVRRVYLDLIGLPPTPEEAEAFVRVTQKSDGSQAPYEQLVDHLLASPQYGERWARRWLDLARYADTNGYEKDRTRSIWPYRDWVINALNADMPFDQFTIEQLAGDMLPGASQEQIIATGFHRNTMLNEEGGIDPLEFRFHAMTDRVATTGKTWLGLTVGCAQCHTHKYDPITHREYYGIFAFLNNADEPEHEVKPKDFATRRSELESKIAQLTRDLPGRFKGEGGASLEAKFGEWLARESALAVPWTTLRPTEAKSNLPLLTVLEDNSILASGDQTKSDTYTLRFRGDLRGVTAIQIEALPDERLPKRGPGRTFYEGTPGDFTMANLVAKSGDQVLTFSSASHSFAPKNFPASHAIDANLQTGWSIDGGQGRAHAAVFSLSEPLAQDELQLEMLFARHFSAGLGRFRVSVTRDTRAVTARDLPRDIEELLLVPASARTSAQQQKLLEHFVLTTPELDAARAEITALRKSLEAFPTTLVLSERPPENPRATFLHHRGEYLQPAEQVEPGVLAVLNPLPADAPRDRLAFAKWLVSRENPLTARVTVNRHWAAFFGRGLVRTVDDFGFQGETPSHPELLDWLAIDFVEQGWSLKKLHKSIVMSATYQQSSRATPELLQRDPENRWVARGPRVRLEAEMIRDSVLRASGLLSTKVGGPSVHPPQPAGVTEVAFGAPKWNASTGEDRYRRGLYTFAKRTAPYAMFSTFDGPAGDVCIAQREVSNTPLQALTMLNDVVVAEAAQALGRALATDSGSVESRIVTLFQRCLTRPPSAEETAALSDFFTRQRQRFAAGEFDPVKLAGTASGDAAERAAWTALARALLNLDEVVTRS